MSPLSSFFRSCFPVLLLVLTAPFAAAQSTGTLDAIAPFGTDVIDSDAVTGFQRDSIPLSVTATMARTVGGAASQTFGVRVQMLDDGGAAIALAGAPGAGTTVTLGPVTVPFGFLGNVATRTFSGSITPGQPLLTSRKYRLSFVLVRDPAGVPVTLDSELTKPGHWWHWTQTVSDDVPRHVLGVMDAVTLQRPVIITSQAGQEAWKVDYSAVLRRYDGYEGAAPEDSFPVTISWRLLDVTAGNVAVALTTSSVTATQSMEGHDGEFPPEPTRNDLNGSVAIVPVSFAGIHPLHDYAVEITLQHEESPGVTVTDHVLSTTATRLLRLNGSLLAGAATAAFSSVGNHPGTVAGAALAGSVFTTQMLIPPGAGSWPQMPGYTFGHTLPVPVSISLTTGVTTLLSGSLYVDSPPGGDGGTVNGVRFVRSVPFLGNQGFGTEEIDVLLPAGYGFGITPTTRRLQSRHTFFNLTLNPALQPVAATFSIPCSYVAHERAPVRHVTSGITWNVAAGTFTTSGGSAVFEREAEMADLETNAALLTDSTTAQRPANDGWHRRAATAALTVTPSAVNTAQLTGTLGVAAGSYRPHFPNGPVVAWTGAGSYDWTTGQPSGSGVLNGAQPLAISHARAVPGDPCTAAAAPGIVNFAPAATWQLGTGGSLRQSGSITSGSIRYGARPDGSNGWTLRNFSTAAFMVPGGVFDTAKAANGKAAAALHLMGTGPGLEELPGTADYQHAGNADYAGLNLRASQNPAAAATQLIGAAGSPVAYALKPCSKYYLRAAGVSGRHEAAPGSTGTVPLWGFSVAFHELAVSLLDLRLHDSRTRGALRIGGPAGPSDFLVELERMRFGPGAELREAAISPLTPPVNLAYWGADITPLTCRFKFTQPGGSTSCQNLDSGFPVLGVTCRTAHFQQPLTGELGFLPEGNIIAAAAPIAAGTGVDSKLRVPSALNIKSNDDAKSFRFTPVTRAAFNDWAAPGRPDEGFLNLAGKLDVPFFDDLAVTVHLSPSRSTGIHLMAPWQDAAGLDPFADALWDAAARGYPSGVSLTDFRSPPDAASPWHPRARREWKGLLFDFPVHWESVRRQFDAKGTSNGHVFVFDVPSELRTLSATTADIGFGVRLGEMPNINSQQLVADIREGFNNIADTMRSALGPEFNPPAIADGLDALQELIEVNPADMLDPALDQILGPTILDALYLQVQAAYSGASGDLSDLCARLENGAIAGQDSFKQQVIARCRQLTDITSTGNAWAQTIIDRINQIDVAVRIVRSIVEKDDQGRRKAFINLGIQLAHDQDGILNQVMLAGGLALEVLFHDEVEKADKTLDRIERLMNGLHDRLLVLRGQVEIGQGFLIRLQEQVQLAQADLVNGPIATIAQRTVVNLCAYLQSQLDPGRTLLADRPDEIRARIKGWIKEHFVAQVFAAELRTAIRRAANEVRETLHDAIDGVFGEVNSVIDKVVLRAQQQFAQLSALAARIDQTVRSFDNLDGLGAGEVKGHARITGDQLDEVRIDANFKLAKPNEMEIRGWLLAKTVSSQSPGSSCHLAGADGMEITIGGAAPLKGLGTKGGKKAGTDASSPAPAASFQLLFALDAGNDVLGLDGRFDITGPVKYEHMEVNDLTLGFGAGPADLYLYGKASGKSWGQETAVSLFFGKNCNLPSLGVMDPRVQQVIETNMGQVPGGIGNLIGFMVYAENWTSLNEVFHIPESCLFSAKIKGGSGYFGFGGTPSGGGPLRISGGVILNYAAKAKILCLVTGEGELLLVPALTLNNVSALADFDFLTMLNSASLSADAWLVIKATLGYCPFCKNVSKSFHLRASVSPANGVDVNLD